MYAEISGQSAGYVTFAIEFDDDDEGEAKEEMEGK